jgi:hypothetical protein
MFFNKDLFRGLGRFDSEENNLASMIRQAWLSALDLKGYDEYQPLVHFLKMVFISLTVTHLTSLTTLITWCFVSVISPKKTPKSTARMSAQWGPARSSLCQLNSSASIF